MLAALVVASLGTSVAAVAAPLERLTNRATPASELAAKQANAGVNNVVPLGTTTYSATVTAAPTFNRPTSCTTLSGVGTAVGFHVQQFTVSASGSYTAGMTASTFSDADGFAIIYQNAFTPATPLVNCVALDDDAGPGNFPLVTATLNAGTQYFLVTTTFANGVTGDFTNTLDGPGTVTLVGAGPSANLGIVKTAPGGVVAGGNYTYTLAASNAGPDAATGVVVSDTLPAGVTFVGSTCGATAAGQAVTWNIGNLANGGSSNCTLTVNFAGPCATVSNTATITGAQADSNPGNNSSTATNGGGNLVGDPGFEAGTPNPNWTEASSNFGTPLCDATCGLAGARTGNWWAWFGGSPTGDVGSATQSVTIPAGANTLTFWYQLQGCGTGGAANFVTFSIDGTELFRRDGTSAECGGTTYTQASINIAAFANGAAHTLAFNSTTTGSGNFFIDDVGIASAPVCGAPPAAADLALTQTINATPPVTIGSTFTATLTVTNNGPSAATSFTVVDNLPAQYQFVSSTCGATAVGQVITWTGGAVPFPGSVSCTFTIRAIAVGSGTNTATITTSAPNDPTPGNNSVGVAGPVITPLAVSGSFVSNVPTMGTLGLALMAGLLALFGWMAHRRRNA